VVITGNNKLACQTRQSIFSGIASWETANSPRRNVETDEQEQATSRINGASSDMFFLFLTWADARLPGHGESVLAHET
jgi:hypothetical protein